MLSSGGNSASWSDGSVGRDRKVAAIVERFESAWASGEAPDLDAFLPGHADPDRPVVLLEIIPIDMEYRWGAGGGPSPWGRAVEDYLARFPELGPDGRPPLELVLGEYRARRTSGDRPEFGEYLDRFTSLGEALREALRRADVEHRPSDGAGGPPGTIRGVETGDRRYRLLRRHGVGGIGEVWIAEDLRLGREVALKVLRPRCSGDKALRARLEREARITGRLEHPGVVSVHEVGDDPALGGPYYVMRLVQGRTLTEAAQDYHGRRAEHRAGPRDLFDLIGALAGVCDAVAYAHDRQVLHRDLKGQNIVLGDFGEVNVLDWGLAREIGEAAGGGADTVPPAAVPDVSAPCDRTAMGIPIGTPAYMAPEQAEGRVDRIDARTDVFNLGAVLYEILTGRPPYAGSGTRAMDRARRYDFAHPRPIDPTIPRSLEAVCLKAMESDRADRYARVSDLARDLRNWMADEPVSARREPPWERSLRWIRRHKTLVAAVLVALILIPASIAWNYWRNARIQAALYGAEIKRVLAERGRDSAENERKLAVQQRAAEERNKLVQQYFQLIKEDIDAGSRLGRTWERWEDLARASQLDVPQRDPVELRSRGTRCLATSDLRKVGSPLGGLLQRIAKPFCLTFSPDGRFLAIAQGKTTFPVRCEVDVVDLADRTSKTIRFDPAVRLAKGDGRALRFGHLSLPRPEPYDGARAIVFSPDSKGLVVGSRSGRLHYWDLRRNTAGPVSWDAHEDEVTGLTFGPDPEAGTSYLYSSSRDRRLKKWALAAIRRGDPDVGATIRDAGSPINDMEIGPDGRSLACALEGRFVLFDAITLRSEDRLLPIGIHTFCMSLDGRTIAASTPARPGGRDGRVVLLDLEHGEEVHTFQDPSMAPGKTHSYWGLRSRFHPDGSLLVTACSDDRDRRVKLWDVASGRLVARVFAGGTGHIDPMFSPDGRFLAMTTDEGAVLYEIGGGEFRTVAALESHPISQMALSSDGNHLACVSEAIARGGPRCAPAVSVRDLSEAPGTGRWMMTRREWNHAECLGLAYSPSGSHLALSGTADRIEFITLGGGDALKAIEVKEPGSLCFSRDGKRLWAAAEYEKVACWSIPDQKLLSVWSNASENIVSGLSGITCLTVGPSWVLAGTRGGTVHVFHANDGTRPATGWSCSTTPINSTAINPVETLAAIGSQSGQVSLFRFGTDERIARWDAHDDSVESMAFSPTGSLLATASRDQTVRLWKVEGGRISQVVTLSSESGPVRSVAFDAKGSRLLVLHQGERGVRIWQLDSLRKRLASIGADWD